MDTNAGPGPGSAKAAVQKSTRPRGRLPHQWRNLKCERSVLDKADGSAKWSHDNTSVLAAVWGPRQAKVQKEDAEKAVVEVVFKPLHGIQGPFEREMELLVRTTLEGVIPLALHPRTSVMVVIQVLQDDGALLSCALNATCAALVDAGVPMNTMFAGVACAVSPAGELLLDPEAKEEQAATANLTLAYAYHFDLTAAAANGSSGAGASGGADTAALVVDSGSLLSYCHGSFTSDQLLDGMELARAGCERVARFSRASLAKSLAALP